MCPGHRHHQRGMVMRLLAALHSCSFDCCMMRSNCHCLAALGDLSCSCSALVASRLAASSRDLGRRQLSGIQADADFGLSTPMSYQKAILPSAVAASDTGLQQPAARPTLQCVAAHAVPKQPGAPSRVTELL